MVSNLLYSTTASKMSAVSNRHRPRSSLSTPNKNKTNTLICQFGLHAYTLKNLSLWLKCRKNSTMVLKMLTILFNDKSIYKPKDNELGAYRLLSNLDQLFDILVRRATFNRQMFIVC